MQPINYSIDVKNPIDSALQGYQAGLGIQQAKFQQQAQQVGLEKEQLAIDQARQMQQDFNNVYNDPTPGNISQLSIKYPQQSENLKRVYDMQNKETQQSLLKTSTQLFSALQADEPEIAESLLTDEIAALRNSGREPQAHAAETLLKTLKTSPKLAKITVGNMLASIEGGDKVLESFTKQQEEGRKQALMPVELEQKYLDMDFKRSQIKDINSQVSDRSARLALDKDKFQSDVQLRLQEMQNKQGQIEGDARKIVNESVINSVASEQTATQMLDLADNLEKLGGGYGTAASASEWLKSATGNQDALSEYRKEYTRLRASQVIKMLPPGSASDTDIKLATSGFPSENADSRYLASFLRGMAKLSQYAAINDSAKAEWVNSVGSLGKPKSSINVDGVNVPAGTSYTDFARAYIEAKTEQRMTEARQQQIKKGGASYMNNRGGGASGSY